ncbi:hypothetical protein GCM10020219_076630 [Nonomuraea dietziae]
MNVVEVFSDLPRGSSVTSTESVRQCRLQSDAGRRAPITSSFTWTRTYSVSSRQASLAVPEQSAADEQAPPSHNREMSREGPGYSPWPSAPSIDGADAARAMEVAGTSSSAGLLTLEPSALVVVMV